MWVMTGQEGSSIRVRQAMPALPRYSSIWISSISSFVFCAFCLREDKRLRIGKGIRIFSIREDGKGTFHPFLSAEFIEE